MTNGCIRLERISTVTPVQPSPIVFPTATEILASPTPDWGWQDANPIMVGICFEAAAQMAGKTYVIHTTNELELFYEQVNSSQLCEEPVNSDPYSLSEGTSVVGLWSIGQGCTSEYLVENLTRDDRARSITIQLQYHSEGNCGYELVEPFWVAIANTNGFTIDIVIDKSS